MKSKTVSQMFDIHTHFGDILVFRLMSDYLRKNSEYKISKFNKIWTKPFI